MHAKLAGQVIGYSYRSRSVLVTLLSKANSSKVPKAVVASFSGYDRYAAGGVIGDAVSM